MRGARTTANAASPNASRSSASGLFGVGIGGKGADRRARRAGRRPRGTSSTPRGEEWPKSRCRTRGGGEDGGDEDRALPPGSVAPPVTAITPLRRRSSPGVAKPWSASRLAIAAKAVPTSIVRVS